MAQIDRIERPSRAQYREAHHLIASYWTHFRDLDIEARFALFERLGVELVLAREADTLLGACFVLPDTAATPDGPRPFVWLFNLYAHPEAHNLGALMLLRLMRWHPAMMCVGVTDQAGQIYRALRWGCYDRVWRCVHPIDLPRAVALFSVGTLERWPRWAVALGGCVYGASTRLLERLLGWGGAMERVQGVIPAEAPDTLPSDPDERQRLVAAYLPAFRIRGFGLIDIGGIGRVVRDDLRGFTRLRAHARMWRTLRAEGAVISEFVAVSKRARRRAWLCGALPVRMPIYYWDRDGILGAALEAFEHAGFTFASCDKIF